MTAKTSPASARSHREGQDPTNIQDLSDELHQDLTAAQETRDQRSTLTRSGHPEWVTYERSVMLDGTIALLIRHQLPIDADETARAVYGAEQSAEGHSDYARTWALGCADYIASIALARQKGA